MSRIKNKSNLKIKQVTRERSKKRRITFDRKREDKEKLNKANVIIGIDNGSTGTLCSWIINNQIEFIETPAKTELNYQKEINYIDRLDHGFLTNWLKNIIKRAKKIYKDELKVIIILERPMVNPQRFDASLNAIRVFEAMLVIIQQLNLNYIVIDSKQWQHYYFGKDTQFIDLKIESLKKGIEIINALHIKNEIITDLIKKHGDADALLITKFAIDKLIKY